MSTTAEVRAVTTTLRDMPANDRAGFLRELAGHVVNERGFNDRPFTAVLDGLVTACASEFCGEPLVAFDALVDAVAESQAFNADPAGYAERAEWLPTPGYLDRLFDQVEGDVDAAVQRLLGGVS